MIRDEKNTEDIIIYFAYGSNMLESRLKDRVPSAVPIGIGTLKDMKVLMNKRSVDGSAKANLVDSPGDVVYGVLYRINAAERPDLDKAEGGYYCQSIEVLLAENIVEAFVYISQKLTGEPVAYDWYRDLIMKGARENGLPEDYIEYLSSFPYKRDIRTD